MCFHTSITSTSQKLENRFNAKFINDEVYAQFDKPQFHLNGFDHPHLPIITQELPEKILPSIWGVVPPNENPDKLISYYKKASKFGGGLNARVEKLKSHFLYKKIYQKQRCLILVDAFFEPHHFKSKSYPYLIKQNDNKAFALGGIYTRFQNGLITCTILTRPAMPFLAEIHNVKKRQPVILNSDSEGDWLNYNLNFEHIMQCAHADYDEKLLETYPIDKKLFSPKQDSNVPEILEPKTYPELNRLF